MSQTIETPPEQAEQEKNEPQKDEKEVEIRELETLIYQQQFETAYPLIVRILQGAENRGGIVLNKTQFFNPENVFLREYTRIASALTTFFAHPVLELLPQAYHRLIVLKKHLLGVFQLSGLRGTDHMLGLIGTKHDAEGAGTQFAITSEKQLMKFLLFYSLDSEIEIDFGALLKQAPKLAMPAYMPLVGEEAVLSIAACAKRDHLLELGPILENVPIEDTTVLMSIAILWMHCSYSNSQSKHNIKKHLNHILQKFLKAQGVKVPPLPTRREKKEKPLILIPVEHFTAHHAMFRCYAPHIKQLREKFSLVLMSRPTNMDEVSKELFDDVIEVKSLEVKKLVGKVIKLKPDMIYYPSLGMAEWTVFLANLRLAPIQFMSIGHPATSNSPFVDYIFMQEVIFSHEVDCFSEKVVLLDNDSFGQMIAPQGAVNILPEIRKEPSPVRIAVMSTAALKFNASFMAVCQRIYRQSQKPVEFHFFTGELGMIYQKLQQRILDWLPDAKIYPRMDYNTYIANVTGCDLHLSTFPFGGTNTNVDSMKQGLPMIMLEGHEPHSRTDSVFFELGNLPSWLRTHSEEEYAEAALRLIHNDEERVAISETVLKQDFEKLFRDHEFHHHEKVFLKAVEWLYQSHEDIQEDGRKVWTIEAQEEWLQNQTSEQT
ncbi:hypothetical protein [Candidatus Parabeggiatoa sp. HSG14]|uniref:hypothetical protein n=1 Tax=Candidatus Parabeggiatoa sp. HSG14 TaxID=3055593 RepID=UPI0025A85158|nr:hypothetical protein [Thiotrichales bacterium HSG14]